MVKPIPKVGDVMKGEAYSIEGGSPVGGAMEVLVLGEQGIFLIRYGAELGTDRVEIIGVGGVWTAGLAVKVVFGVAEGGFQW